MNKLLLTISVLTCMLCLASCQTTPPSASHSASPDTIVGRYTVEGWEESTAGAPHSYFGTAQIIKSNQFFFFRATMDNTEYHGPAIFDRESGVLSLAFTGSDHSWGCTQLRRTTDGFKGWWASGDGTEGETGYEVWKRQR